MTIIKTSNRDNEKSEDILLARNIPESLMTLLQNYNCRGRHWYTMLPTTKQDMARNLHPA